MFFRDSHADNVTDEDITGERRCMKDMTYKGVCTSCIITCVTWTLFFFEKSYEKEGDGYHKNKNGAF